MKKIFIALKPFNNRVFYKNAILTENSGKDSFYLIAAKKILKRHNFFINTIDINYGIPTYKDIYMDVPYPWEIKLWLRIIRNHKKSILFIVEPPIVNPFNHMRTFHLFFSRIYTQNDNLVDNIKYFKFFLPKTTHGLTTTKIPFKNKKMLILMNANLAPFLPFRLFSSSTKELYTQRIEAIDFFDTNYPADFCLYGKGWNKPQKFSILQRLIGYRKYKTYQGQFPQKNKHKILSKFKFCLCFENCETTGYISEKIIDCFKARCVPIYLGAPNISNYINPKCFIDFRKFKNYQELVEFLSKMDEKTYNGYLKEIEKFLSSKEFLVRWTGDAFAKLFLRAISL